MQFTYICGCGNILYVKLTYTTFERDILYTKNAPRGNVDGVFYILNRISAVPVCKTYIQMPFILEFV